MQCQSGEIQVTWHRVDLRRLSKCGDILHAKFRDVRIVVTDVERGYDEIERVGQECRFRRIRVRPAHG